ncbi:Trypsin [Dactylellina cionopaga]|nr:Trypsin [Dactylellina cionopaga]
MNSQQPLYTSLLFVLIRLSFLSVSVQAIIGGSVENNPLEFRYIVSIRSNSIFGTSHNCGGVIIAPHTVLTAAHCLDGFSSSSLQVAVGDHNRTQGTVTQDLLLGGLIVPALLPLTPSNLLDGQTAKTAGWGRTSSLTQTLPVDLQEASSIFISRTACNEKWQDKNQITKTMLCISKPGISPCNGDSGGPITDSLGLTVIGIVSFADQNCPVLADSRPPVGSDVFAGLDWIRRNMR